MPAKTVPAEERPDQDPSWVPDAWDALIVPALELVVHPVRVTVALVLTENAPTEMVATESASAMPLEELAVPCEVVAEAPTSAAVTPLKDDTIPAAVVAEISGNAMDTT